MIGDFLVNLAASLAYTLLEQAYKKHFTDPQRQALESVYAKGFQRMLASTRRPLTEDEMSSLSDILTHFITQSGTADAYLALAIHNDKPDLEKVSQEFKTFGGPDKVRGLDFLFERGLLIFYEGLTEALTEAAGHPDSPLMSLVTVNQNRAILRVLTQIHDLPVMPVAEESPTQPGPIVVPVIISPTPQYYTCFISYSHKNEEFVTRLYNDLKQAGVRCWFAPMDLAMGDRIRQTIDDAIGGYDKLLVVLSRYSVKSSWVEKEVETAFDVEQKRKQKKREDWLMLFPIRLDNAVMKTEEAWAADIRNMRNIGDFSKDDMYQVRLQRLLRDLKKE